MSVLEDKSKIRNVGIMAHIDAGKTTTTERFLFYSGYLHKIGQVDDGTAFMDFMTQEKERGITIMSAVTPVEWRGYHINIIDTPGHVDFTAEVQRSLRVLDGAIAVFCAVAGVQPQTETVWCQADEYQVPRIAYINKMDRTGADFFRVLDDIRTKLNVNPVAVELPIGAEGEFRGTVDLLNMRALAFESESYGAKIIETEIPENLIKISEEYRTRMIEVACDMDDVLLEKYLLGEPLENKDICNALKRAVLSRNVVPVLCGSSLKNMGIQPLIEAVVDYLPSPLEVEMTAGYDVDDMSKKIYRKPTDDEKFSALAFKIVTDPYVGRLTYLRIYSGVLKVGDAIYNVGAQKKEKILKIMKVHANKRDEISIARAGEIIAVPGLRFTITGDTLSDADALILYEKIRFAEPVINQAIEAKTLSEQEKLLDALKKLTEEDPTFFYKNDSDSGQIIIHGVGELHLEIIVDRLKREFGVDARVGRPQVAYKESIGMAIDKEGFFDRVNGKGMYSVVGIHIEPAVGKGLIIESDIVDKKIPKEFIQSALEGAKEALNVGPQGYPMMDIMVRIVDIKYDDDTLALACKIAASIATKDATRVAMPVLLEPLFQVDVISPEDHVGDVIADLNTRRGRVEEIEHSGGMRLIKGKVPLSEMFGYVTKLRSLTQGRASYSMFFSHYEFAKKAIQ